MKKAIKFTLFLGFAFLAIAFISSLFIQDLSLIERLHYAITLMSSAGFVENQIQAPREIAIICSTSGPLAFLSFSVAIILYIVRWIIRMSVKEIEDVKTKSA